MGPLVSIGIPTFNRPGGLVRTLQCILAQTHQHIEIIISDNDSPGPAVNSILNAYASADRRIRIYRQPCNVGAMENFKFVLRKAVGTHFMWAADDDEWDPQFIERCLEIAVSGGSAMAGFSTIFRTQKIRLCNPLPTLSQLNSKYENTSAFLSQMQPSFFYGLHKREDILFILNDKSFDFYDCYFVLKLILNSGFSTTDKQLYLAGVDGSDEYKIKYDNSGISKPFLNYCNFYIRSISAVLHASGISFSERLSLSVLIDKTVLAQITHHERCNAPRRFLFVNAIKVMWQKIRRNSAKYLAPSETAPRVNKGPQVDEQNEHGVMTYSQSGEDAIVAFILKAMRVQFPTYLDIGAHHPWKLSNTYRLYCEESKGVCVEPDPDLHSEFLIHRPKDINLNVGVGIEKNAAMNFFIMSNPTLNTFSEIEARRYDSMGTFHIREVIQVPVVSIEEIIDSHFSGICPDFISIDVEGLDLELVKSIDFSKYRPKVLCVETLTYSEDRTERKLDATIEYVKSHDYIVYADTYINTIFVDRASWKKQ